MKISFNDKSLHTTFEYPSESSLAQEEAEEEEEEEEDGEEEEVGPDSEKTFTVFLPRATFVSRVGPESNSGNHTCWGWAACEWNLHHTYGFPCPLSLVHRSVQLHSKAFHGLQQVAGADTGTSSN